MSIKNWKTHVFYTTADADKPEQLCNSLGEVVHLQCKHCGANEDESDNQTCTEFLQEVLAFAARQQ